MRAWNCAINTVCIDYIPSSLKRLTQNLPYFWISWSWWLNKNWNIYTQKKEKKNSISKVRKLCFEREKKVYKLFHILKFGCVCSQSTTTGQSPRDKSSTTKLWMQTHGEKKVSAAPIVSTFRGLSYTRDVKRVPNARASANYVTPVSVHFDSQPCVRVTQGLLLSYQQLYLHSKSNLVKTNMSTTKVI